MTQPAAPEIMRADPRTRRRAIVIVLTAAALGTVLIGWLLPAFQGALLEARATGRISGRAICLSFLGLLVLVAAGVIASGVNIWRIGSRAVRSAQFPPPGMMVMRDTPIVRGQRAIALGRVQRILGLLLLACAMALLALSGYAGAVLLF
jgi:hypothetical protein